MVVGLSEVLPPYYSRWSGLIFSHLHCQLPSPGRQDQIINNVSDQLPEILDHHRQLQGILSIKCIYSTQPDFQAGAQCITPPLFRVILPDLLCLP